MTRQASDLPCLRCGRDGHTSDECPRPVPAWPAAYVDCGECPRVSTGCLNVCDKAQRNTDLAPPRRVG